MKERGRERESESEEEREGRREGGRQGGRDVLLLGGKPVRAFRLEGLWVTDNVVVLSDLYRRSKTLAGPRYHRTTRWTTTL